MRFLLAGSLLAIAMCAHAQVDRNAYTRVTLREALAMKDQETARLRFYAPWMRQTREPGKELAPLLAAWRPGTTSADLDKFVEMALYEHGTTAWVLLMDPAFIAKLSSITPGVPGHVFVHRIGFAGERPVFVVADMQFGPETLASARFANGQASFVYAGKRYVLKTSPAPNAQRPPLSEYRKLKGDYDDGVDSLTLDYADGSTQLTMSMTVNRGAGEYPAGDGAGAATVAMDVTVLFGRGVMVHVAGNDFAGCTLKIPHVGAARVQGRVDCPRPLPSGFADLQFELTP